MDLDAIKKRFIEEVKLRAYDDKYIDLAEEKEILQIAIKEGISIDSAIGALRQVCANNGYIVEAVLNAKAKEMLAQFANDGVIDKKEFFDVVGILKTSAEGKLSETQCQKKAKNLVLENEWKVKEGMLSGGKWFSSI